MTIIIGATAGEPIYRPPDGYPLPSGLPNQANIRYWWAADHGAYSDVAGTELCSPGEEIAHWTNLGNAGENAVQNTLARRPIWRSGGQGGRPFIECDAALQQYFEDLQTWDMASGITNLSGYTCYAVVWRDNNPGNGKIKGIFGDEASTKGNLYIQTTNTLRVWKNQFVTAVLSDSNVHAAILTTDSTCDMRYLLETGGVVNVGSCTNAASTAVANMQFLRTTIGGASGIYWDGELYEVIVFNGAGYMNATNMALWMNYFKDKYVL